MTTTSMRRQTLRRKKREKAEVNTRNKRNQAVFLLNNNKSYRAIHRATGLSMGTIGRLKGEMKLAAKDKLPYDDSEHDLRRGRKPVLTFIEERAIIARLKECERHGFAISKEALRSIAGEIANDGRGGFPNGSPSDDWIRGFRSRHRDITFRKMESREGAKIAAANPEHVKTLVQALKACEQQNPGILSDPTCIWNMDETKVSISMTETEKGFVSADTNHGGQKMTCDSQGKHLTAVVIASAAGDALPPFFIFAGANNMDRWYNPLSPTEFKDQAGVPHWLTRRDWFPENAFVTCSENGSMTQELIPYVLDHIQRHAPKYTKGKKILLLVDGHKSRNGHLWLTKAKEASIEVIQSPANTSHFLQACDQSINKQFKAAARATFHSLGRMAFLDFGDMSTKLKLGTAGFKALTPDVVQKSFEAVGIWPMNFRFLKWAEEKWTGVRSPETEAERRSIRVELQKQYKQMREVMREQGDITFKIDRLENIITAGHSRVQYILAKRTSTKVKVWKNPPDYYDRTTLSRGAPAVYLTHGELIRKRKEAQETQKLEKERKAHARREAALRREEEAAKEKKRQEELALKRKRTAEERERKTEERRLKKQRVDSDKAKKKASVLKKNCESVSQRNGQNAVTDSSAGNVLLRLGERDLNKPSMTNMAPSDAFCKGVEKVNETHAEEVMCNKKSQAQSMRCELQRDDENGGGAGAREPDADAAKTLLKLHDTNTKVL